MENGGWGVQSGYSFFYLVGQLGHWVPEPSPALGLFSLDGRTVPRGQGRTRMKDAEAEVSLKPARCTFITPLALGASNLEVLEDYEGERFSNSIGFIVKFLYLS